MLFPSTLTLVKRRQSLLIIFEGMWQPYSTPTSPFRLLAIFKRDSWRFSSKSEEFAIEITSTIVSLSAERISASQQTKPEWNSLSGAVRFRRNFVRQEAPTRKHSYKERDSQAVLVRPSETFWRWMDEANQHAHNTCGCVLFQYSAASTFAFNFETLRARAKYSMASKSSSIGFHILSAWTQKQLAFLNKWKQ